MSALDRTPDSTGFLQPTKFQLSIPNLNLSTLYCQEVNLPGVSIEVNIQPTPFANIPRAGSKLVHDPLSLTMIIDDGLKNWIEIHTWIEELANPERFSQTKYTDRYYDGILTFYSNLNNPKLRAKFIKMFPISISGIQMDTKSSAEETMTATVVFKYDLFEFLPA